MLGEAPWIPPGQPTLQPGRAGPLSDLRGAWADALGRLRREFGHDRGAIDIFLAPLQPVVETDGVLIVRSPSADCARWVARHLQVELAGLAEILGRPIGLVADPVALT